MCSRGDPDPRLHVQSSDAGSGGHREQKQRPASWEADAIPRPEDVGRCAWVREEDRDEVRVAEPGENLQARGR